MKQYIVDAFTDRPFTGNPAAVCILDRPLSDARMQQIAAENNIPSFVTGRHFEVCKYFTFTEHQRVPDVLVMSRKIWDELTAEQKGWIEQAAADANVFQRQAWRESEVLNEQIARDAGVEFITVDRTPFMELSKPIYDAFPADLQDLAKRIREVK